VPQRFFTKFPKTINRVKLSDNRDRNRVNSEIQSGYQKHPFPHVMIAQALLLNLASRRKSDLSEKLGPSERGCPMGGQVAGSPQLAAPAFEYRYFSTSTTYLRITLVALSRWGARSVQAFDL
jgi:hypothetical protein